MSETLVQKKVLYCDRLFQTRFVIAIDGTGMLGFSRRHCRSCLTRTQNGKTVYFTRYSRPNWLPSVASPFP